MKRAFGQPVDVNGKPIKSLKKWKEIHPRELCFDSKFEWECYKLLEQANFNFTTQPETREVIEGFTSWALSRGKQAKPKLFKSTVRNISYTSDFAIFCNNGVTIFIEAKGFFHKDARMRYKLFQRSLKDNEMSIIVFDKVVKGDNLRDIKAIIDIVNEQFGGSTPNKVEEPHVKWKL